MPSQLILICGPTATGKTRLGVALAKALGGEVVSADSMQVYRDLVIGTARPTQEEMAGVPHHMMGVADPRENYSVARYVQEATACVEDIFRRGRQPIVVGGTGLYLDALCQGRSFSDFRPETGVRTRLQAQAAQGGLDALWEQLRQVDPETAARLHPHDAKRIIRALEVWYDTGQTISQHNRQTQTQPPRYQGVTIALTYRDRQDLYQRIDQRVDQMMARGLAEEVRALLAAGIPRTSTAMQAIGYKELVRALDAGGDLAPAVEEIKRRSRQYAKRQLTWFRRKEDTEWILLDKMQDFSSVVQISTDYLREKDYHRRTKDKRSASPCNRHKQQYNRESATYRITSCPSCAAAGWEPRSFWSMASKSGGRSGALTPLWWSFTATESSRWCTSMPSPLWSPSGRCPGRRKTRIDRALPRVPAPPDEAGGRGEIEKG